MIKTISEERNSPKMSLLRLPRQPLAPRLRDSEFLGFSLAGSEYITPSREDLDLKQCQEVIVINKKNLKVHTGRCIKRLPKRFVGGVSHNNKKLSP